MRKITLATLSLALLLIITSASAQSTSILAGQQKVITTSVPFLGITPDTRAGGMADVGVATSTDANSIHWNPAKLAFATTPMAFAVSYTPWLRAIVPDISLSYLAGYKQIDDKSAIGASLRYFSLGDITFTDNFGTYIKDHRPYEMAADISYARKLSAPFSIGVSGRFIYSNLAGKVKLGNGNTTKPGIAFAGDFSGYHTKKVKVSDHDGVWNWGFNISNIGNKITYTDETQRDFIPINLKLGTTLNLVMNEYNEVSFSADLNKLLVPSNPIYKVDKDGNIIRDSITHKPIIEAPKNIKSIEDISVPQGMIQSFFDSPGTPQYNDTGLFIGIEKGSGFKEEIHEINPSIGIEYWYQKQFAGRIGYFYEHPTKGGRQYITLGAGIRYQVFGLDFAYLMPTTSQKSTTRSPLDNTIRFSLTFNFDGKIKPSDAIGTR